MNRLIQKTFDNRGYTNEYLRDIEVATYDALRDIDNLAVRLKEIHDDGVIITVFPDFDTDGLSAGTVGFAGLSELGFRVNLYVPNPSDGYGVTPESVQDLMSRFPDTQVIITCDTGIGAFAAADYCEANGIEFLVTDHHTQKKVSSAKIIVNPLRLDETYSHPGICGAFVLYQVLQRYADLYCNSFTQEQIRRLRVFAGIGTISDTMPLLYENRQLVRDAVNIVRIIYGNGSTDAVMNVQGCDVYRRSFWGLYYAAKVCETYGVIKTENDINEEFFGFYLAPIFNSTKRMEDDMSKTFGIFFGNQPEKDMVDQYNLNLKRKESVELEFRRMMTVDQPYAPYIYMSQERPGILGLLAMKVFSKTGYPAFVVVDEGPNAKGNRYHGSGRAPEWFPCLTNATAVGKLDSILKSADGGLTIEGHACAFGCGIKNETSLKNFYEVLKHDVPEAQKTAEITEDIVDFVINTDWSADTGIDIPLFDEYLEEIEDYRPFGKSFPGPNVKLVFCNNDVVEWKAIGKAKQHLKISLMNGFDILCWNQAHLISQKDSFDAHSVIGHLGKSEFRGVTSINFVGNFVEQGVPID